MSIFASAIAHFLGRKLIGCDLEITAVYSFQSLRTGGLAFFKNMTILNNFLSNGFIPPRTLLIVPKETSGEQPFSYISSDNPKLDFAKTVTRFFTEQKPATISPLAIVAPTAIIGSDVTIGPFSIIGDKVVVGDGTVIKNNVIVHEGVSIGENCTIKAFASIGEEGFGFAFESDGTPVRLPHLGTVIIRNNVEVGNFCTVCRGTLDATIIGNGTKIDDHCHISHNVQIGENVIVTACVEISGSATIGNRTWIGPNASILNQTQIESKSLIAIGSVVIRNVKERSHVLGNPAKIIGLTEDV
jgi:UDP-3-O-[3-hydroxymyristoyl] glucosamine N-acyltransferase